MTQPLRHGCATLDAAPNVACATAAPLPRAPNVGRNAPGGMGSCEGPPTLGAVFSSDYHLMISPASDIGGVFQNDLPTIFARNQFAECCGTAPCKRETVFKEIA